MQGYLKTFDGLVVELACPSVSYNERLFLGIYSINSIYDPEWDHILCPIKQNINSMILS